MTYDRPRRYDREYDRSAAYDRGLRPDGGRYFAPFPGALGYPAARWGWGPIGWAGWGPGLGFGLGAPYGGWGPGPVDYEEAYQPPRRRPEESPAYGQGGDRAVQRWSRRYGYDVEYTIRPRPFNPRGGQR